MLFIVWGSIMRVRHIKNINEKIKECSKIILNPIDYKGKWDTLFKNNNPIYLEIGMGKGKFIIENALKYPDINFIGCELCSSIIYKASKVMNNIENIFLINYDAYKLNDCFEKKEIGKIYLNFSDPWPKTRHEKRRLTSPGFIKVYESILANDGVIEFKTDNRHLFEYSVMKFNELNYEIIDLNLDLHCVEDVKNEEVIKTEYEEKFTELGNKIYYIKVRLKK